MRLCHNQRFLNGYITKYKFQLDLLREFAKAIGHGDFLFAIDLTSAYTHILIHPKHRRFMGFRFRAVSTSWQVSRSVCPVRFGSSRVSIASSVSISGALYASRYPSWLISTTLSDHYRSGISTPCTKSSPLSAVSFLINEEKCCLELLQHMGTLGFILDTLTMPF